MADTTSSPTSTSPQSSETAANEVTDATEETKETVASMLESMPVPWTDADAATRRKMIIDQAIDLLHQEGLQAVTMRRLARELGVGTMTLYTYLDGQHGIHQAMVARGFDMLNDYCSRNSTLDSAHSWQGGARAYLMFAIENPNLYKLMFDHPLTDEEACDEASSNKNTTASEDAACQDHACKQARKASHIATNEELLRGGYEHLLEKVRGRLAEEGLPAEQIDDEAQRRAGHYWIGLHGLATLAIAGRMSVFPGNWEEVLDDLLPRIAPTGREEV